MRPSHPRLGTPLLDSLPHLGTWLESRSRASPEGEFALIQSLLEDVPTADTKHPELAGLDSRLQDLRHFLALAYSTYQRALDRSSMERWIWRKWLERYRKNLHVALSWNYDLVLERALTRNRVQHFHPGAGGWPEWHRRPEGQVGIPICKPHGSIHFAPDGFELRNAASADSPFEAVDYPRATEAALADVPQRCMTDHELLNVRTVADIVLPGEFNRFGQHLSWMRLATRYFRHLSAEADTLVIAGFSFSEPDRTEFADLISWVTRFERAIVIDPSPSDALLAFLTPRAKRIETWRAGPQTL